MIQCESTVSYLFYVLKARLCNMENLTIGRKL